MGWKGEGSKGFLRKWGSYCLVPYTFYHRSDMSFLLSICLLASGIDPGINSSLTVKNAASPTQVDCDNHLKVIQSFFCLESFGNIMPDREFYHTPIFLTLFFLSLSPRV